MRLIKSLILAFALATLLPSFTAHAISLPQLSGPVYLCFTPGDDCTNLIVTAINQAKKSIYIQAYSFTSPPIAQALTAAASRGVHVEAVLDKSQRTEKYSGATYLANAGISVFIDAGHAIAHNKIMVMDDIRVITGSFNFTKSAQDRNDENLLILEDPTLAQHYLQNFIRHRDHSEPYSK